MLCIKEFTCFSYDENHKFHQDASSLKYYYTPRLGADLSQGFDTFQKQDDSTDEHLDSLLKAIMAHEQKEGKKIDTNVVTWRGMMTKVLNQLRFMETIGKNTQRLTYRRSWLLLLRGLMGRSSMPDSLLTIVCIF
jgi:hypothetical protein